MNAREVLLVYDKECPVCDAYCRRVDIDEEAGALRLVDARGTSAVMDEITRQGLDIDQGMVLKVDGVLLYGGDAIHALSGMQRTSGVFGVVTRRLFGSKGRARVLYPALRSMRNLLLKVLRKAKINNLNIQGHHRF